MLFLYKFLIQKEINHIDIQNAVIIIPTLADIVTHDDLRERIAGQREGLFSVMAFSSVPNA